MDDQRRKPRFIDAHRGEVGGGGRVNIIPPSGKFQNTFNKNAIKPKIGGPTQAIFPGSLDPLGILAKNIRYPLPWIFNPCASMPRLQQKPRRRFSITFSRFKTFHYWRNIFINKSNTRQ
jgi:hypothetical protein